MCGFAGFFLHPSRYDDDAQALLTTMGERLAHRGPDGRGILFDAPNRLGMVHNRLSFFDLSAAGLQPMWRMGNDLVLAFNGEIYNHAFLRKELEARGYSYRSTSDTETILHAYHAWGMAAFDRFNGMFSCALFDARSNELLLIRDRSGMKPLYMAVQGKTVSFASEIKALFALPWVTRMYNDRALQMYLTTMVAPAPLTAFQHIYKIPAGHYVRVAHDGSMSCHEWYSPAKPCSPAEQKQYQNEAWCTEQLTTLLRTSVRNRMLADVPVGAFLSGGVDSSLVVALMAEYGRVATFTIGVMSDEAGDERRWARRVATHFGTTHHEITLDEQRAFDTYESMIYHADEPLADCVNIPFYHLAQLAHRSGIKAVQVGEGADELFFGYSLYAQYCMLQHQLADRLQRIPQGILQMAAAVVHATLPEQHNYCELVDHLAHRQLLFRGGAWAWPESSLADAVDDPMVEFFYPGYMQRGGINGLVDYHLQRLLEKHPQATTWQKMLYVELVQRLPELLLMRADKMSMAASIEARVPFLDHHLIEFAYNLPLHLVHARGQTKYLLKKVAERFLPSDIVYRRKVGFAAPVVQWFERGTHFPPYFNRLAEEFSSRKMKTCYAAGAYQRAVQWWTLHQEHAFKKLVGQQFFGR